MSRSVKRLRVRGFAENDQAISVMIFSEHSASGNQMIVSFVRLHEPFRHTPPRTGVPDLRGLKDCRGSLIPPLNNPLSQYSSYATNGGKENKLKGRIFPAGDRFLALMAPNDYSQRRYKGRKSYDCSKNVEK